MTKSSWLRFSKRTSPRIGVVDDGLTLVRYPQAYGRARLLAGLATVPGAPVCLLPGPDVRGCGRVVVRVALVDELAR